MVKRATTAERAYLGKVAALGCVLCKHIGMRQESATQVHHIREGQGAAQRAEHFLTVALCFDHHLGANGLHGLGVKGFYTRYKLDELDLLAMTIEFLNLKAAA